MRDRRARLRLAIFLTGLATLALSTYLSHLWPSNAPDWFYYGFIAKYYAKHGDYPKVSWWREDQPPFIYKSPIIALSSLLVDPRAGPHHDYRFVLALIFGVTASVVSWLIEPRMGTVVPWFITAVYNLHSAGFLGGKRTICCSRTPSSAPWHSPPCCTTPRAGAFESGC
ncbi:MAG: hypothetical protein ACXQTC_02700 [Methanopyraceae archaeon]